VDVAFSSVFLVHVLVRDMHVLQCRMVVLVDMGRKQMRPVLPLVQVVRYVVMLVPVFQGLVLMIAPRPRHRAHPSSDRHSTGEPTVHPRDGTLHVNAGEVSAARSERELRGVYLRLRGVTGARGRITEGSQDVGETAHPRILSLRNQVFQRTRCYHVSGGPIGPWPSQALRRPAGPCGGGGRPTHPSTRRDQSP
jgi:hypothetical protein